MHPMNQRWCLVQPRKHLNTSSTFVLHLIWVSLEMPSLSRPPEVTPQRRSLPQR